MASTSPHDALFKFAFTDIEEASSLLRSQLPPDVAQAIDWKTLVVEPGSYVDETLSERRSDILFSCRTGGASLLIYLLLEHQSSEDRWMALRMLRYVLRICDRRRKDHPEERRLPRIVPIVLYHGSEPWSQPTEVLELFEQDGLDSLEPHLPKMEFLLDDLTAQGEEAIGCRALTVFAEVTLRLLLTLRRSQNPILDLQRWLPFLSAMLRSRSGLSRLRAIVEYIRSVVDVEDRLLEVVQRLGPAAEEVFVTAAERLRKEGREDGLREGREDGLREGRAQLLMELLVRRFGPLPPDVELRVKAGDPTTIKRWSERIFEADRVEDLLEDG